MGRDNREVQRLALSIVFCVASAQSPFRFENIAQAAGLRFVLENSPTPQKHMVETMAGGVAVFDYNGDGRPDIFFTNGAALPSLEKSNAN